MQIGGFSYAGTLVRNDATASSASAAADANQADETENPNQGLIYFRSISSISPGSLADAYQAMKVHDISARLTTEQVSFIAGKAGTSEAVKNEAAILSGVGIPAAMSAYRQIMDADYA